MAYEKALKGGKGPVPELIEIALICKEYGWTEYDYDEASEEFTQAIRARRNVEAVLRKQENEKLEKEINSAKRS
jgi:hypothetical protein